MEILENILIFTAIVVVHWGTLTAVTTGHEDWPEGAAPVLGILGIIILCLIYMVIGYNLHTPG